MAGELDLEPLPYFRLVRDTDAAGMLIELLTDARAFYAYASAARGERLTCLSTSAVCWDLQLTITSRLRW
jgi:hypothetical protein